jgi:hypothetical protein
MHSASDGEEFKMEERKNSVSDIIENDSQKSMQAQKTKRIDHVTIDNDFSDSDDDIVKGGMNIDSVQQFQHQRNQAELDQKYDSNPTNKGT